MESDLVMGLRMFAGLVLLAAGMFAGRWASQFDRRA